MSKNKIYFVSLLFFLTLTLFIWSQLKSPEEYLNEYYTLMQKAQVGSQSKRGNDSFMAMQERIGVTKAIYFFNENRRLNMQIFSKKSDLVYDHRTKKAEVIEKLSDIQCYMQEELYYLTSDGREVFQNENGDYIIKNKTNRDEKLGDNFEISALKPMQKLRYIKATNAIYEITNEALIAYYAEIYQIRMPGHQIPEIIEPSGEIIVKTYADEITMKVEEKGVNFSAKGLKGQMDFVGK